MTVPVSYTESEFIAFLHGHVTNARLADLLAWEPLTQGDAYAEIAIDTLLAFGQTDFSGVTAIAQLRAVGRVLLWRKVQEALVLIYNFSTDAGSYSRDQINTHVATLLSNAEREAGRVGGVAETVALAVPEATITDISIPGDPYAAGSQAPYYRRYHLRPRTS